MSGKRYTPEQIINMLRPVLARYSAEARPSITRRRFRVDAAFAIPALFDVLEAEGWDYAIRIKGNPKLHEQVTFLTRRRPGRPPNHLVRHYTSFQDRAKSWSKPRRIVAKVRMEHCPHDRNRVSERRHALMVTGEVRPEHGNIMLLAGAGRRWRAFRPRRGLSNRLHGRTFA